MFKVFRKTVILIAVLLLGAILGVFASIMSLRTELLVDPYFGDLRQHISICGVLLREDDLPITGFESIPVNIDDAIHPRSWKRAFVFRGWSHVSPSTQGGEILDAMTDIASLSRVDGSLATQVKTEYLLNVSRTNPNDAARTAQIQVLDILSGKETGKETGSDPNATNLSGTGKGAGSRYAR